MTGSIPIEHVETSVALEADKPIDLWEFTLRSGAIFRLRDGAQATFQGNTYEPCGLKMGGEGDYSDDQVARPTFGILDEYDAIAPYAAQGAFDYAVAIRRSVLPNHLEADLPIFAQRLWLVARCSGIANKIVQFELRAPNDMPDYQIPPRMYLPPEFPFVSY